MKLRWKTFESGMATKEIPAFGFSNKPYVAHYSRHRIPILQVSHDDVTWHDVPSLPPIPYEDWSNE